MLGDGGEVRAAERPWWQSPRTVVPYALVAAALLVVTGTVADLVDFGPTPISDRVVQFGGVSELMAALLLAGAFAAGWMGSERDARLGRLDRGLRITIEVAAGGLLLTGAYAAFVILTTWAIGHSQLTGSYGSIPIGVRLSAAALALSGAVLAAAAIRVASRNAAPRSPARPRAARVDLRPRVLPAVSLMVAAAGVLIARAVQAELRGLDREYPSTSTQVVDRISDFCRAVATPRLAMIVLVAAIVLAVGARPTATARSAERALTIAIAALGFLLAAAALFAAYRVVLSHNGDDQALAEGAWARTQLATRALSAGVLGLAVLAVAARLRRSFTAPVDATPDPGAMESPAQPGSHTLAAALAVAATLTGGATAYQAVHTGGGFAIVDLLPLLQDQVSTVLGLALGAALVAVICGVGSRPLTGALGVIAIIGLATSVFVLGYVPLAHHGPQSPLQLSRRRDDAVAAALAGALLALAALSVLWNGHRTAPAGGGDPDGELDDEIPVVELTSG